jgi:hypothetical protein
MATFDDNIDTIETIIDTIDTNEATMDTMDTMDTIDTIIEKDNDIDNDIDTIDSFETILSINSHEDEQLFETLWSLFGADGWSKAGELFRLMETIEIPCGDCKVDSKERSPENTNDDAAKDKSHQEDKAKQTEVEIEFDRSFRTVVHQRSVEVVLKNEPLDATSPPVASTNCTIATPRQQRRTRPKENRGASSRPKMRFGNFLSRTAGKLLGRSKDLKKSEQASPHQ